MAIGRGTSSRVHHGGLVTSWVVGELRCLSARQGLSYQFLGSVVIRDCHATISVRGDVAVGGSCDRS